MSTTASHIAYPFIDGISCDDTHGLPPSVVALFRRRGLVWLTKICIDNPGEEYRRPGGYIVAATLAEAERIAFGRGLDEEVIGLFAAEVPA